MAAATTIDARLRVTPQQRELRASWRLTDGSTVEATYRDRVEPAPPTLDLAVDPSLIVSTKHDRSMADARRLLQELATAGLAEVASPRTPELQDSAAASDPPPKKRP